jgi:hypothetical protein
MPYIGNQPQYTSFLSDTFSGNGSTTVFTMTVAPANTAAVIVAIWGVLQDPTTYGVVGRILTFSQAPPTGTGNISVRYLSLPASNITTTAYRSVSEFTATAGQTTFTPASYTPGFINVFRSGVRLGATNFTATNGVTVVLTNAAAAGDLITVESFFVSAVLNAIPAVPGQITPALLDSTSQLGTGALLIPSGTTAQRPTTPIDGMVRYNSTTGQNEIYQSGSWNTLSFTYTVDYLIVAGGGGGGAGRASTSWWSGGGGGAGGVITGSGSIVSNTGYTIIVGAGGNGQLSATNHQTSTGVNGNNSTALGLEAIGGGAGGSYIDGAVAAGRNGGSGGGAGGGGQAGGSGTVGQGNIGGTSVGGAAPGGGAGGGGGGAGAVGGNAVTGTGGAGGAGINWQSLGTLYGGGGGGAGINASGYVSTPGTGGAGGGGNGAQGPTGSGGAGTANRGGGGGGIGGDVSSTSNGGAGGSGIVIIRYLGTQRGLGGTVTSAGGFTYHTFTSSGTFRA